MARFYDENGLEYIAGSELDLNPGTYTDSNGYSFTVGGSGNAYGSGTSGGQTSSAGNAAGVAAGNLSGNTIGSAGRNSAYDTLAAQLRNSRAAVNAKQRAAQSAYQAQLDAGLTAINNSRNRASENYQDNSRQAYTAYLQSGKRLPQMLRASGINGGAAESSNVKLEAGYGNQQNALRTSYQDALAQLDQQEANLRANYAMQLAQANTGYNDEKINLNTQMQNAYLQAVQNQNAQQNENLLGDLQTGIQLRNYYGAASPIYQNWLVSRGYEDADIANAAAYSDRITQAKYAGGNMGSGEFAISSASDLNSAYRMAQLCSENGDWEGYNRWMQLINSQLGLEYSPFAGTSGSGKASVSDLNGAIKFFEAVGGVNETSKAALASVVGDEAAEQYAKSYQTNDNIKNLWNGLEMSLQSPLDYGLLGVKNNDNKNVAINSVGKYIAQLYKSGASMNEIKKFLLNYGWSIDGNGELILPTKKYRDEEGGF